MKQSLTLKSKANKYYPHKELRKFWRIVFIVIIATLFYFHSVAQGKDTVLLADETILTYCPVLVKISTSNETIYKMLVEKFKPARKMEKPGVHWTYYRKEDVPAIKEWFNIINSKKTK